MNKFTLLFLSVCLLSACSGKKLLSSGNADQSEKTNNERELTYLFIEANKEKLIGNTAKAMALFEQVISKDPDNDAAYFELGKLQAESESYQLAEQNATKAIKLDPDNRYYYFLKSEILKRQNRIEESAKVMEDALKVFPKDIELYYELATQYIAVENYTEARKTYERAIDELGENPEISLQIVRLYLKQGNLNQAETGIKKLVNSFPNELLYQDILGEIHLNKKELDKAETIYQEILKQDPANGYAHFRLSEIYSKQGRDKKAYQSIKLGFKSSRVSIDDKVNVLLNYFEFTRVNPTYLSEAYELCKLLIEVHSEDPKSYAIYGDFLLRDRKFEAARTQFRASVERAPDKHLIWNEIIVIDAQLNDTEALLSDTEKALTLFPNMPDFYLYRGIALAQQEEYEEAAAVFEAGKIKVIDNPGLKAEFYSNLGDIYHELEEHKKSDKAYEQSLKLVPENPFVLNNYSYYLSLRKEKLDKAASMSKKANELQPGQASFLDTYGWILYQLGKYEEAKIYLDQALDNGGMSSGTILEHYGDVLYQLGDKIGAIEYWKKAKSTNENSAFLEQKIREGKLYE